MAQGLVLAVVAQISLLQVLVALLVVELVLVVVVPVVAPAVRIDIFNL